MILLKLLKKELKPSSRRRLPKRLKRPSRFVGQFVDPLDPLLGPVETSTSNRKQKGRRKRNGNQKNACSRRRSHVAGRACTWRQGRGECRCQRDCGHPGSDRR